MVHGGECISEKLSFLKPKALLSFKCIRRLEQNILSLVNSNTITGRTNNISEQYICVIE